MQQEIHEGGAQAPVQTNASAELSARTFSNPDDFLKVLRLDFDKIARSDADSLSRLDLIEYANHGADPKGRAAAKIAAEHFDQLQQIPDRANEDKSFSGSGISRRDLVFDEQIVLGDTENLVETLKTKHFWTGLGLSLAIGAEGAGAICATIAPIPPLAIGLAALIAAEGTVLFKIANAETHAPDRVSAETANDQKMIGNWLELY